MQKRSAPATIDSSVERAGVVSVVVVNYRGADDTIECIAGLRRLDWPAEMLQIVVVDNASGDDGADRIAAAAPDVVLVRSDTNTGFAGGCNLGVANATGEYLALINSDARPDPSWLRAAVDVLRAEPSVGAIASKVLDWEGRRIDFAGGHVNFAGQGYKPDAGLVDDGSHDEARNVLFFTGSAAVIRAATFRALGGFDEQLFMFFEDVDLGWRMNLRGYQVRYLPTSLVFHKHHAAIAKFGSFREQYLLARNSLITIYKNFGDDTLSKALAPALLLSIHNANLIGGDNPDALDLERAPGGDDDELLSVTKSSLAGPYAVEFLVRHLEEIDAKRKAVQRTRVRSDTAIAPLLGDLLLRTSPVPEYAAAWEACVEAFGLTELLPRQLRVLIVTADTLTTRMAGPAIRAFNIAQQLSKEHEVTLASTTTCTLESASFACVQADDHGLKRLVAWSDIVIFQGFVMHEAPWLGATDKIIIVDIYDPIHLEQLEQGKADNFTRRSAHVAATIEVLNQQLARGDFFLCASEEQRHFWLGQLAGVGRLNPANYDRDSSLQSLLAVASFGLPDRRPEQTRSAIKDAVPGIGRDDKVILWGGGVYNWFDPLTVISAVDRLRHSHDDIRLFFLGMKHPNPNVPDMNMAVKARQLSEGLGLTGKYVFFNDEWVDYEDRANYLLDADVGVSAHFLHAETTFSFRTRILDYLWAGLPIVTTEGDAFGRIVATEELGAAVAERDVAAMANALESALYDEVSGTLWRKNVARVREQYTWERTLAPLIAFCRAPLRAEDATTGRAMVRRGTGQAEPHSGRIARNVSYARAHYREGGMSLVAGAAKGKLKRLLRG